MTETATLLDLLTGWVPQQRWWAGGNRSPTSFTLESRFELPTANATAITSTLVIAADHDGDVIRYQVPVTILAQADPDRVDSAIGSCDEGQVYDALHEPAGQHAWISLAAGTISAHGLSAERTGPVPTDLPGRWVGVEQSNTSVVYAETVVLKTYRRLAPGTSPDLEIGLALAGTGITPDPLAWVTGDVLGTPTTLALVQPWLRGASDGWRMATASVRDLFAEGDLHANEVGGDLAPDSFHLGQTTARMHAALAEHLPTSDAGAGWLHSWAGSMHDRLHAAITEVPELDQWSAALRNLFDEVSLLTEPVALQRIHGDLHLGQVLRNGNGWHVIDFEGEPSRSVEERRALSLALRDVAGMLRSFDYASQVLLAEQPDRTFRAHQWSERNRTAFCDGYSEASGRDPRDQKVLLKAVEADKAIYEVVYEARHRPSWLPIPLAGLERLLA